MIDFNTFVLENGLRVLVHEDPSVQIAVMNMLYDVGSRDEQSNKTGFAHLFEHFMFGGSVHIPDYDEALQKIGGENNAFTSVDLTNYYLTVSMDNIETGFWLESDRMLGLSFDPNVLEVQKKVVIEEFKQCHLNQPYGDAWMKLCSLAYRTHPYRWTTIGEEISHIEKATMEEAKVFFHTHYTPDNAILVLAGNVQTSAIRQMAEKWFAPISKGKKHIRKLPLEPPQIEKRVLEVEADVPADMLYKTYHMPGRFHDDFYVADLLSAVLGQSDSSHLHQKLVKEKSIFNSISSFTTGTIDPGLMVLTGMVKSGVDIVQAEREMDDVVYEFADKGISDMELEKVKNQALAELEFNEVEILNRAINLAFATLSGNVNRVNEESDQIVAVSKEDVKRVIEQGLKEENSSVLYYKSKK